MATTSSSPTRSFGAAMMEENISSAEDILAHWAVNGSSSSSSTESLHRLLQAVGNLHRARHFFFKDSNKDSSLLVRSQVLMDEASKRLQVEFHRILSSQRDVINSENSFSQSSSYSSLTDLDIEDYSLSPPSTDNAIADLKSIARCMVYCGHGKECINVYRLVRRSFVEESLYNMGFDRTTPAQLQKLPWETIEDRIWKWAAAAKPAVRNLFSGERVLCRQTFSSSSSLRVNLFGDIAGEAAEKFFAFPEIIVSKIRLTPEKIFRLLDMYETVLELYTDIDSIFSLESTSKVRVQVETSLNKLGEAIRFLLDELETAIKKDNTKVVVQGGGLHPLVRYVANFVSLLADYNNAMDDIFFEKPADIPPGSPIHHAAFMSAPPSPTRDDDNSPLSGISLRLGTIVFSLLCKLDSKAELYGDPALGYLFLANNLQYLVRKARKGRLIEVLGEDWVMNNAARARRYAASYKRIAWKEVMETIPEDLAAIDCLERMRRFNEAFDTACRRQEGWIVTDKEFENEVKLSISKTLMEAYRPLYVKCRGDRRSSGAIRFAPEDLAHSVSDLFCGTPGSSVYSGHGSSSVASSGRIGRLF